MLPFFSLLSQLLPGVTAIFAGDHTGSAAERMADAIKELTKKDKEEDAHAALEADPKLKLEVQSKLAEIALEETKEQNRAKEEQQRIELDLTRLEADERERVRQNEFQTYLRDLQDRQEARSWQTRLAEDHNPLAWVAPIIAILLVFLIFYLLRGIMVAREPVINKDVFNVVLGALVTAFTTVIAYYFGSSVGSRQKDDALKSGKLVTNPKHVPEEGGGKLIPSSFTGETDGRTQTTSGPKPRPGPPPSGPLGLFQQKAPVVMRDLMQDLGLTAAQAAGILGNIGVECAGFRLLQEQKPLRGGRGGWGWCQWTGPRRVAFEGWASERKLDFAGDAANYGFLLTELRGSHSSSVRSLRQTHTVDAATTDFMNTFERPAAQFAALDRRIRLANLALQEHTRAFNG